jgi:hypothetical protein
MEARDAAGQRIVRSRARTRHFTETETWEEVRSNALEAVSLHFEDCAVRPRIVQVRYSRHSL